jgi:Ni,Fe-hydrogenase I cytochrome b subunit
VLTFQKVYRGYWKVLVMYVIELFVVVNVYMHLVDQGKELDQVPELHEQEQ